MEMRNVLKGYQQYQRMIVVNGCKTMDWTPNGMCHILERYGLEHWLDMQVKNVTKVNMGCHIDERKNQTIIIDL